MHVILGTVDPVDQICDYAWIFAVRWQDVNVRRVSADVCGQEGLPTGAEHLQPVETYIVAVTPGGQDIDNQSPALRKHWDLKIIIAFHGGIIIGSFALDPLSSQRGTGAPGCCQCVSWDRGRTSDMTLKELIKDVPIERHVGNASTLALVELTERVPGLPKSLILLAVQLGHGRTLSAVDDQRQRLLWRKHTDKRINVTAESAQTRPEAPTAAEDASTRY